MATPSKTAQLTKVDIHLVKPNKHNPRLVFRSEELDELAESIHDIGLQVPITVYRERSRYTLIDGERRWRACQMINLAKIPAIIYPKPTPLQNIVFMFNIHRFRKDWDPLPTAMKLEELKQIIEEKEGSRATEAKLAAVTGMSRGAIRRCKLIMEIPKRDRARILGELAKPERGRRITTDLFIEVQRSVRTIASYLPELRHLQRPLRAALVKKYENEIVPNMTHMRMVARIARAQSHGAPKRTIKRALEKLVEDPEFSVEDAFKRVAWVYDRRSINNQAKSLQALLDSLENVPELGKETRNILAELGRSIRSLLDGGH